MIFSKEFYSTTKITVLLIFSQKIKMKKLDANFQRLKKCLFLIILINQNTFYQEIIRKIKFTNLIYNKKTVQNFGEFEQCRDNIKWASYKN